MIFPRLRRDFHCYTICMMVLGHFLTFRQHVSHTRKCSTNSSWTWIAFSLILSSDFLLKNSTLCPNGDKRSDIWEITFGFVFPLISEYAARLRWAKVAFLSSSIVYGNKKFMRSVLAWHCDLISVNFKNSPPQAAKNQFQLHKLFIFNGNKRSDTIMFQISPPAAASLTGILLISINLH